MSTRTYVMRKSDKPDWMVIAPLPALTKLQWKVLVDVLAVLTKYSSQYVTIDSVAILSGVSKSTSRKTLEKLADMGLLYRRGQYPRLYGRKVWYP